MVIKCTLIPLHELKYLMVSVYCRSIGGIFYIIILKKSISQIERHTHTFGCPCCDPTVSIKYHITYFNYDCLKSVIFGIIIFKEISPNKIRSNSNKGERKSIKIHY